VRIRTCGQDATPSTKGHLPWGKAKSPWKRGGGDRQMNGSLANRQRHFIGCGSTLRSRRSRSGTIEMYKGVRTSVPPIPRETSACGHENREREREIGYYQKSLPQKYGGKKTAATKPSCDVWEATAGLYRKKELGKQGNAERHAWRRGQFIPLAGEKR